MFQNLALFIVICNVFLMNGVHSAKQQRHQTIDCDNDRFDLDMAKLVTIGEYGRSYPENVKQLRPYCDESQRIANRIEQFKNKCFRGEWKNFVSVFLYSNRNALKQFCQKNNRRVKDLLKTGACANANKKRLDRCMSQMTDNMIGIKYAPDRKKIPFLCCEYLNFLSCFKEAFERSDQCQDQLDIGLDFMRSIMGNVINNSCGQFNEDTDQCQKIGPPPKKKSSDNSQTVKTVLYPIYDVLNSIQDN